MPVLRAIQIIEQYFNAHIQDLEKAHEEILERRTKEFDFDKKTRWENKRIQNVVAQDITKTHRDRIIERIKEECLPKEGE